LFIKVHPSTGKQMKRFHFLPKSVLRCQYLTAKLGIMDRNMRNSTDNFAVR
jgi:hypothetical protein